MNKDVIVTISGLHMVEGGESSPVDLIAPGEYYYKNGKHYLFYDEVMEEFGGITKNRLIAGEEAMELFRTGVSQVHMVFERDRNNLSSYQTPCGNLLLGICARGLRIRQKENAIDIGVRYDLNVNDEHLAECSLNISIRPREAESFSLGS